eukprot:6214628-Pleurochrysis_carterae.AAC.2
MHVRCRLATKHCGHIGSHSRFPTGKIRTTQDSSCVCASVSVRVRGCALCKLAHPRERARAPTGKTVRPCLGARAPEFARKFVLTYPGSTSCVKSVGKVFACFCTS